MRMAPLLARREDRDQWRTPPDLFRSLSEEFGGFDLDVACEKDSALCTRYITSDDNAFLHDWTGRVWMNPPYSDIGPWMRKAHESVTTGKADLVVALVPARTGADWFHEFALKHEVRFLRGRLRFSGSVNSAPFDCCLVIMRRRDAA